MSRNRRTIPVLFGLLLAGAAAWIFLRPASAPPPAVLHPTARQAAQVETRLEHLQQTATRPGTSPRTLRLSESDLNVYLASSPATRKLLTSYGVQSVQVVLQEPASLIIHAAVRAGGVSQNVQIEGTLAPDPQTGLRFAASRVLVGSLPLPAPAITAQTNALAARISSQFHQQLPITVQSVSVQQKDLVIVGRPVIVSLPVRASSPQSASPGRR